MSPLDEFFEASCKKIRLDATLKAHLSETFIVVVVIAAALAGVNLALLCALYVARKLFLVTALLVGSHRADASFVEKKRVVDELEVNKKGSSTHSSPQAPTSSLLLG